MSRPKATTKASIVEKNVISVHSNNDAGARKVSVNGPAPSSPETGDRDRKTGRKGSRGKTRNERVYENVWIRLLPIFRRRIAPPPARAVPANAPSPGKPRQRSPFFQGPVILAL